MRMIGLAVLLALGLFAAPLAAEAQPPDRVRRLGLLLPYVQSDPQAQARVNAFRAALQERGWTDGRNIRLEFRYSASLARPGANITGASLLATELTAKRLQLLKEVLPALTRVAVFWSAANASVVQKLKQIQAAAPQFRVQLHPFELREPDDLDRGFESAVKFGAQAVMTTEDAIQITYRVRVVELGKKHKMPVASEFGEFAQTGALMSFGPSILDQFRYAASYVDKLLNGARPGDLPVEQATRFELIVNLKTAKALGLTIPPSVLGRADQVIE